MQKIYPFLWLYVLPVASLACAPAADTALLRGVHHVFVDENDAQLIQVRQFNEDLVITVTTPGGVTHTYDSPAGRNALEYVYLPPGETGEVEICLESAFAHSARGAYEFATIDVSDSDAQARAAFAAHTEASRLWKQALDGGYEKAAALYASSLSAGIDDPDFSFFTGLNAALASFKNNRYADAKALVESLLAGAPNRYSFLGLMAQATIAMRERRYQDALVGFELTQTAITRAETAGMGKLDPEKSDLLNLFALTYLSSGELDLGKQYLDQAIAVTNSDHRLLGLIYNNLGFYSIQKAAQPQTTKAEAETFLADATQQHLLARYFSYEADDIENMILIENNTAVHYRRIGERHNAQKHYSNALELLDRYEMPQVRNLIYSNLWQVNISLGDYHKAMSYLESAVSLTENSGNALFIQNLCRLGDTSRLMNALPSATIYHADCYTAALANADTTLQARALLNLSKDYKDAGQRDEAESQILKAFDLLPQITDQQLKSDIQAERALYFAEHGNFAQAWALFEQASAATDRVRYPESWISSQEAGMKIALMQQDFARMKNYAYDAIAKIEDMYSTMEAERIGPAWSNRTHQIYVQLFDMLIQQFTGSDDATYLQEAFLVQERSRSISMRQQLANPLEYDDTPPDASTLKLISEASSLLAAGDQLNLNRLRIDYYHHQDLLALARMSGLESLQVPPPITMDEVQAQLAADQLVLHYTMTEQYLYLLLVTHDAVSVKRLAGRAELEQTLQNGILKAGASTIAIADLQRLSQLLLPASTELDAYPNLLIVPHSGLYQVPFAALSGPANTNSYAALVGTHTIKVLPSLSAYFMDKPTNPLDNSIDIAVIADPEFTRMEPTTLASLSESEMVRSWSQSVFPLPYSAQEANNLTEIFGTDRVHQYTGRSASRANLVSPDARNAKILHIATHGYFKSTSDDNVGLALTTVTEDGQPDPGYITLTELFSYRFANELVVISGCDTAMGLEQFGEGLNSLARGFLSQGASHVISTLWPVSDKASAKFMALFYRNLQQTKDVALALQAVQKNFMADPLYRNPYYWAGYVLTTSSTSSKLEL